jgi:hypothetical protein
MGEDGGGERQRKKDKKIQREKERGERLCDLTLLKGFIVL